MYTLKIETAEGNRIYYPSYGWVYVQNQNHLDSIPSSAGEQIYVATNCYRDGILCEMQREDGHRYFVGTNYYAFLMNEEGQTIEVLNRPTPLPADQIGG